jgi:hypothetical protein
LFSLAATFTDNNFNECRINASTNASSPTDAANNAYVEDISDMDWVDETLKRLRDKDVKDAQ